MAGKEASYPSPILPVALAALLLGACSTSPYGRAQITTPAPVSAAYSEMDMRLHLATADSINTPCGGTQCTLNQQFDQRVQSLGARLATAAFSAYPELSERIDQFTLVVAEKKNPGTTSNASGKIVIFRGVQDFAIEDDALAFLLAREMGHVIGHHHDENSATRVLFSVLAGVLFPAANLFNGGSAAAAQATSVTSSATVATAAASTATSIVGSEVVLASIKPNQLNEADTIALGLLDLIGWNHGDIANALENNLHISGKDAWSEDLRVSVMHVLELGQNDASATTAMTTLDDNSPGLEPSAPAGILETAGHSERISAEADAPAPPNAPAETIAAAENSASVKSLPDIPQQATAVVAGTITAKAQTIIESDIPKTSVTAKPVAPILARTAAPALLPKDVNSRSSRQLKAGAKSSGKPFKMARTQKLFPTRKLASNGAHKSHRPNHPARTNIASVVTGKKPLNIGPVKPQPLSANTSLEHDLKKTSRAVMLRSKDSL